MLNKVVRIDDRTWERLIEHAGSDHPDVIRSCIEILLNFYECKHKSEDAMYLIRTGHYNQARQAYDLPIESLAWLRWFRDEPGAAVYRFHNKRFEVLSVVDQKPEGGSGTCTLPVAVWKECPLYY